MILEFAIENYRSFKERQVFSLIAESTKRKGDNVFDAPLPNGGSVRLLKSAVIYGANASGKSNLVRAIGSLVRLIRTYLGADRHIFSYDPFLFSRDIMDKASVFELTFLLGGVKYYYKIAIERTHVAQEELVYYPKGQPQKIYTRSGVAGDILHKSRLGKNFGNREIDVFRNQPVLNKFGTDTPHEALTPVYSYFSTIDVASAFLQSNNTSQQIRRMLLRLAQPGREHLIQKIENLIVNADTKITKINISQHEEFVNTDSISGALSTGNQGERIPRRMNSFQITASHPVYQNEQLLTQVDIPFEEESEGTKALFWRAGLIIEKLETGGLLVFDELDNSLHPKLVKWLIKLFTNPRTNPNNAQLIFATHEVTLLDHYLFRTDQIWFTEKNDRGESELFSAQDFDGIREDVPFDKWYMAGKFGGLPKIEDIESILGT